MIITHISEEKKLTKILLIELKNLETMDLPLVKLQMSLMYPWILHNG